MTLDLQSLRLNGNVVLHLTLPTGVAPYEWLTPILSTFYAFLSCPPPIWTFWRIVCLYLAPDLLSPQFSPDVNTAHEFRLPQGNTIIFILVAFVNLFECSVCIFDVKLAVLESTGWLQREVIRFIKNFSVCFSENEGIIYIQSRHCAEWTLCTTLSDLFFLLWIIQSKEIKPLTHSALSRGQAVSTTKPNRIGFK